MFYALHKDGKKKSTAVCVHPNFLVIHLHGMELQENDTVHVFRPNDEPDLANAIVAKVVHINPVNDFILLQSDVRLVGVLLNYISLNKVFYRNRQKWWRQSQGNVSFYLVLGNREMVFKHWAIFMEIFFPFVNIISMTKMGKRALSSWEMSLSRLKKVIQVNIFNSVK